MDVFGVGHDLLGRELSNLVTNLLMHFVENPVVRATTLDNGGTDLAQAGFGGRAAKGGADVGRKCSLDRGVADAEIVGGGGKAVAQIGHQLADGGDRRLLTDWSQFPVGCPGVQFGEDFVGRDGLGRGVSDPLGDDLVVIDFLAAAGHVLGRRNGARQEL